MPTPQTVDFIIFIVLLVLCLTGLFASLFLFGKEVKYEREKERKYGNYNDPQGG